MKSMNQAKIISKKGQHSFEIIDSSCSSKAKPTAKRKKQRKNAKVSGRKLKWENESDEESEVSNQLSTDEDEAPCFSCGRLYGDEVQKYKPHWVSCDVCTVWTLKKRAAHL